MRRALVLITLAAQALVSAAGCHGRQRVVGTEGEVGGAGGSFGAARLIQGLLGPADALQDPTLTQDELEIYFSSDKSGTFDIWRSTRAAVGQPWPPATQVDELSTAGRDYEPELADGGLTIYVAQDIGPMFRILVSHRATRSSAWSTPAVVSLGDPPFPERGPSVDQQGVTLVFASSRLNSEFDLYQSRRPNAASAWEAPLFLAELNTEWQDWDAGLFLDGLALGFGSQRGGDHRVSDLYESHRASRDEPFGAVTPLVELNTAASEGDPWFSNDGRHVVFASQRGDGVSRLFEAFR